jgi:branched-chain amino acid transport system substrate-binding protein
MTATISRGAPATLAALLLAALGTGCAQMGRKSPAYGPTEQARAEQLFATLEKERAAGKLDVAALAASDLVNNYPRFARIDEALLAAGDVAAARGEHAAAATYFETLVQDYPASPLRVRALDGAADAYAHLGDSAREAEALIQLLESPAEPGARTEASRRLNVLAGQDLTAADLEALARRHPESVIARAASLRQARSAYAAGDYERCHDLLFAYLQSLPQNESGEDARRLMELAAQRRQTPPPGPATRVNPDLVGLLFPQTGNLALYGRLFEQGARLAVEEHNASRSRRLNLVVADSHGGAVGAVKAVRRLVVEDGVVGVVGDVFTLPAVAGAIESNAWRTPIVSPVVASDELAEIGAFVFQTRVPSTVEATAVAEAAVKTLGLERFAVLAPSRGDRRDIADFFAQEVRRLGRQVIAVQYFEEGATDFRAQLEKIRDATPDALFVTGSLDELLQILPQVKFHDMQAQLLGLSQWNSDKLLRLARDELEGALFPAESHYGSTPERDRALREKIIASGATEVSPVTLAGYYGTLMVVTALEGGGSSREDVRGFLERTLKGDAEVRAARAAAVPLVRVHDGRPESFAR